MKKIIRISIFFILISIIVYNNSSRHVSQHLWKYNDYIFEKGYEDVLVFQEDNNIFRYEWPYVFKHDKKIGLVVFCIGDRMWMKYLDTEGNIVEYAGK